MRDQYQNEEAQEQRKFGWNAYEHQPPITARERLFQRMAGIVTKLVHRRVGRAIVRRVQRWPVTAPAYRALLGYRRPFASFAEAETAIAPYLAGSAPPETPDTASGSQGLKLSPALRPSDYPALFHLRSLERELRTVFDLGGNAGNLYYTYSRVLNFRPDLRWIVFDLPVIMDVGKRIANERGATALHFTGDWSEAEGVDMLLTSSALHYVGEPLPVMIRRLNVKPTYIPMNRTALTEGATVATGVTVNRFRVAWLLYNRRRLIDELGALGYEVLEEWRAPDFSFAIPGYPEYDIPAFRGILLRLADVRTCDVPEVPQPEL